MKHRILLVDDEPSNCESLKRILLDLTPDIQIAHSASDALAKLNDHSSTIIITDLKMPGLDGIELLKQIKQRSKAHEVILVTAYGSIPTAVEAMKFGAYDFLTKPLKRIDVISTVRRAQEILELKLENINLRKELSSKVDMIGCSESFVNLLDILKAGAMSDAPILLTGESGTGKGVAAQWIHDNSSRVGKPFVHVNCAAIPETLLESELFGHERGAFTGANSKKEGRFEIANEGTIFLDEIGSLSPQLQVKLLRILQDGTFERLGSNNTRSVDVRIISATNEVLRSMIESNQFREDLYFRLNVIEIQLPPLRERKKDIPIFVEHFLRTANKRHGRNIDGITRDALELMENHSWPGNIRELQNIIERSVILCKEKLISAKDLPGQFIGTIKNNEIVLPVGTSLKEAEKKILEETLKFSRGNKTSAAKILGIAPRTIYRKMTEKGVEE